MAESASMPGWEEDGYITKRITDLLTYQEWNLVFRALISQLPSNEAQSVQDRMDEVNSCNEDGHKIKIANRMIRRINNSHHELYMDELVYLRGLRLTVILPNANCDDSDFLKDIPDLDNMDYMDLAASSMWSLQKLKLQIQNHCHIAPADQLLFYKSKRLTRSRKPIRDFHVVSDSRLFVLDNDSDFVVFVSEVDSSVDLIPICDLTPESDVRDLRLAIAKALDIRVPRLWFNDESLSDGRSLESYGIEIGDMIEI